jgi:hypothetical protein
VTATQAPNAPSETPHVAPTDAPAHHGTDRDGGDTPTRQEGSEPR